MLLGRTQHSQAIIASVQTLFYENGQSFNEDPQEQLIQLNYVKTGLELVERKHWSNSFVFALWF